VDVNAGRAGDVVDQGPAILVQHAPEEARAANEPRHLHPVVAEGFGELIRRCSCPADHDAVLGRVHPLANRGGLVPVLKVVDAWTSGVAPGAGSGLGRPPVASSKRSYGNVLPSAAGGNARLGVQPR